MVVASRCMARTNFGPWIVFSPARAGWHENATSSREGDSLISRSRIQGVLSSLQGDIRRSGGETERGSEGAECVSLSQLLFLCLSAAPVAQFEKFPEPHFGASALGRQRLVFRDVRLPSPAR